MHDDVGIMCEREMIIAYNYYANPSMRFFKKVNIGREKVTTDSISEKVENMAWDLLLLRFLESNTALELEGRYFVPHFMTLDKGLAEIFDTYPIKGTIYDMRSKIIFSISKIDITSFLLDKCGYNFISYYLSNESKNERKNRNIIQHGDMNNMIKNLLIELESTMNKQLKTD